MTCLPQDFVDDMRALLPEAEMGAFLHSYEEPYVRGIRLNPMKRVNPAIIDGVMEPIPWANGAYYLDNDSAAGLHPLHEGGAYYIQDASAMVPVAVLNAQPGERVLDLCAAPGGKTTYMGCAMKGEGLLVANEIVPKRAQILSRNVERMGIPNALVISENPTKLRSRFEAMFDAVLVDAPCSGEGMFRRHPETIDEWTRAMRDGCAQRQSEILDCAADMVRPGGRMVYATCTYNRHENEDNVAAFLNRHPDFRLRPFALPGIDGECGMFTCFPHRVRGEGQFAALMVREGDEQAAFTEDASLPKADKKQRELVRQFDDTAVPTHCLGGTLVSMPQLPDVKGLKVYRTGLHLGEMKGKVFAPDHAWALSFQRPDKPVVELTEEAARQYLRGETIDVDEGLKGFVLPAYQGVVLGWGKAVDGVMKNHYPKGLRR